MNKNVLIILSLGWVLLFSANSCVSEKETGKEKEPDSAKISLAAEQKQARVFWAAVADFQQLAQKDYTLALSKYGNRDVSLKFKTLDEKFWTVFTPEKGWAYFFNVSVFVPLGSSGDHPLAAFYNPWSDLYFIASWEKEKDHYRLVDVEMVMADIVRQKGKGPFSLTHYWVHASRFKPEAVGMAVAESILAFENLIDRDNTRNWRSRLPILEKKNFLQNINYPAAAFLLRDNLLNIAMYHGDRENPELAALRTGMQETVTLIADGKTEDILRSAQKTPAEVKEVLLKQGDEVLKDLYPVAFFVGSDGGGVFAVKKGRADYSVSFLFNKSDKDGPMVVRRIDIISYAAMYDYFTGARTPLDKADQKATSAEGEADR